MAKVGLYTPKGDYFEVDPQDVQQAIKDGNSPNKPTVTPTPTTSTPTPTAGKIGMYTPTGQYFEVGQADVAQALRDGNTQAPGGVQNTITSLNAAKDAQIVAGLQGARNNALSNLSGEEAKIKPMYYNQRNKVSAGSQLGAKNFAEYLASRGEINSGVNDAFQIERNRQLQSDIGGLRQQESADFADIERRRTGINNVFETDLANARAGLQTASLEQQIAEQRRQQDIAREDARYADTRADVAYNRTQNEQETKVKQFVDTINRFYDNFQAEINKVKGNNDPSDDWEVQYLEAARAEKIKAQAAEKQAQLNAAAAADKELYSRAFTMWKESGVASAEIAAILGIPQGSKTESYLKTQYDLNKPYYAPKDEKPDGLNYEDYYREMKSMLDATTEKDDTYTYTDSNDQTRYGSKGKIVTKVYTPEQVLDRILGLPIDQERRKQLIRDTGLTQTFLEKYGG